MLAGKPLLAWTIECAKRSKELAAIELSTDDDAIAAVGRQHGINVVRRPEHLATDDATTLDVVRWHLFGLQVDAVMVLQPTCPFRRTADIDGAIQLMRTTACDSVVSYVRMGDCHPCRMAAAKDDGRMIPYEIGGFEFARRQDLPPVYLRSGDIYLSTVATIDSGRMIGEDVRGWVIPEFRHCNIDTATDLKWAEFLMAGGTC
jgi:CMP-N,N'-diacetyllegionaminic acid synthase